MTRILFPILLLMWFSTIHLGQTTQGFPLPASLKQQIITALAPLDKSQVPGGYLLNQTTPFVSPTLFSGQLTDTIPMRSDQFTLIYNQFRSCYVGSGSNLPDPSVALFPSMVETTDDTVQIGRMALLYGMIRNDALAANLLQEVNGQYHDVPGRIESPYVGPVCLAATALVREVTTLNPVFTLPNNFAFSNINLTAATWQIDVSDGSGFQPISATSSYLATYNGGGTKRIKLKMTYQQVDYYMFTEIIVNASLNNLNFLGGGGGNQYNLIGPDETIYLTADKAFQGPDESSPSRNAVRLDIFYACDDKQLRKPIIFVGGYENPRLSANLDNTWRDGLMVRIRKDFSNTLETLPPVILIDGKASVEESLKAAGYDLIYVDWANGVTPPPTPSNPTPGTFPGLPNGDDYIQRNAFAIEKVLKWVNDRKKGKSGHKNILIGGSMGGLVCKYALLDMQQNGEPHDCRVFITYDSPLTGANIPLGTQAAFRFVDHVVNDVFSLSLSGVASIYPATFSPTVKAALGSLDRPAFRQMVIQRCRRIGNNLYIERSPEFSALMDEIAAMGMLNIEHIAITNGSNPNVNLENEVGPGGILTDYDMELFAGVSGGVTMNIPGFGSVLFPAAGASMITELGLKIRAEGAFTPTEVFVGKFRYNLFGANGLIPALFVSGNGSANMSLATDATIMPLSTMPGGNSILGALANILPYELTNTPLPSSQYNPSGVGVSTQIGVGSQPLLISGLNNTGPSQFFSLWFGGLAMGEIHVHAPLAQHCTFIPSFSALSLPLPTTAPIPGSPLPCANPVDRCSSPTRMLVNPNNSLPEFNQDHVFFDDRIANLLLELAEPGIIYPGLIMPNNLAGYFNAALPSQIEIGGLTIQAGGKLSVNNNGSAGTGGVNFPQASENPYTAFVTGCNSNTLIVEKNGSLFIGSDDHTRTGHVIALEKSVVHLKKGSYLAVLGNNSSLTINQGSKLIIDTDALIDLQLLNSKIRIEGTLRINGDFKFFGNGYFEFGPEAKLEYGPAVTQWTLAGRSKGQRFIRLEGKLEVPAFSGLILKDGLVEHVNDGVFICNKVSYLDGERVTFQNKGALDALRAFASNSISMRECDFYNFSQALTCEWTPLVWLKDCRFERNFSYSLRHQGYGMQVRVEGCTFLGGVESIILENTREAYIHSNFFQDVNEFGIPDRFDLFSEMWRGAVRLANVAVCDVKKSHFINCSIGITNPEHLDPESGQESLKPSNIFIEHSSFNQCGAGVYMLADQFGGAVTAACTVFNDNHFGIAGADIKLGIDGGNNAPIPGSGVRSNHFIIGTGHAAANLHKRYIQICYTTVSPALVASTFVRGNSWFFNTANDLDPQKRIIISDGCDLNGQITWQPAVLPGQSSGACGTYEEYTGNPNDYTGSEEGECEIKTNANDGFFIHHDYNQGYLYLMMLENMQAALPFFIDIANHYVSMNLTYSDNCRQYIAISRAIVEGFDRQNVADRLMSGQYVEKQVPDTHTIYPNPASDQTRVKLPDYACIVTISDMSGNVVRRAESSHELFVDTSGLPSGVYLVQIQPIDQNVRTVSKKLAIQRL